MDRGDNPSGEVAKCTDINLSIPVTPLYDINKGLWWYCLLQSAVHSSSVVFFILQQTEMGMRWHHHTREPSLTNATSYHTFRSTLNKPRDTVVRKKDGEIKQKRYQRSAGDALASLWRRKSRRLRVISLLQLQTDKCYKWDAFWCVRLKGFSTWIPSHMDAPESCLKEDRALQAPLFIPIFCLWFGWIHHLRQFLQHYIPRILNVRSQFYYRMADRALMSLVVLVEQKSCTITKRSHPYKDIRTISDIYRGLPVEGDPDANPLLLGSFYIQILKYIMLDLIKKKNKKILGTL